MNIVHVVSRNKDQEVETGDIFEDLDGNLYIVIEVSLKDGASRDTMSNYSSLCNLKTGNVYHNQKGMMGNDRPCDCIPSGWTKVRGTVQIEVGGDDD